MREIKKGERLRISFKFDNIIKNTRASQMFCSHSYSLHRQRIKRERERVREREREKERERVEKRFSTL